LIDSYKIFVGKLCTILTQPVSFPFRDGKQHSEFFTGRVTAVDRFGIWMKHLNTDTIAFFTHPIIGIIEEQFIPKDDPRYEKIKSELESKQKPLLPKSNNYVSVEELTEMAKKLKK
jgi:hypothetical protein